MTATRRVSAEGRSFLYGHEGVVLRAYRCAAGDLTIGAGLTTASGVVTVKPGMTITAEENDRLVDLALSKNYVPGVLKALGSSASQDALDGGTSFHYNTGAIGRASWVKDFRAGNSAGTRKGLAAWKKGGGKVLPGLVRRRAEEADVILLGKYPHWVMKGVTARPADHVLFATFVVSVTPGEIEAIRTGFRSIGFEPGAVTGKVTRVAVEAFQKAYDLSVDAKIGRATLSTLQREIDARSKAKTAVTTTAVSTPVAAGAGEAATNVDPYTIDLTALPDTAGLWLGGAVLAAGLLYGAWLAWHYRDMIAVRLAPRFPKTAAFLRSF
ncbi:hypothetical protein LH464_17355 [Neorhizobium sp. T786]|uniref:glycoside hydrolase family protein n=1 Tax=Pseudorhizobium xiangyangii TaxID=2883104 RepID=UPI001CFF6DC3|nr:peptidoglycan-binding protein [Neorhizobium xiangyangii]MCB5204236.1 hypothetical protein [Neorhizobium xiangyangii]